MNAREFVSLPSALAAYRRMFTEILDADGQRALRAILVEQHESPSSDDAAPGVRT